MTLPLDQIVFRTRALAQAHPFSARAQSYFMDAIGVERKNQPAEEIGIWAGYAMTVGYCLRKLEESDARGMLSIPEDLIVVSDLEELTDDIAERISDERADGLLLYPEPLVVEALDRIIAGEVERRLSHGSDEIDRETFATLENYLAWWTLKGYALRVAEVLTDDASS
ncbi:MAG TPA: hypothetical protein VM784_11685 [Actinomycetota bacterium]|nr:hypothetical protein [Actinomycetota bacterium]